MASGTTRQNANNRIESHKPDQPEEQPAGLIQILRNWIRHQSPETIPTTESPATIPVTGLRCIWV